MSCNGRQIDQLRPGRQTRAWTFGMGNTNISITYKIGARDRPSPRSGSGCRRSAQGLADGGRLDRPGGARPRRHPRQQAGRRRRHPARHVPSPAIMVARRPGTAPPQDIPAGPPDQAPRMPGDRTPMDRHYNQPVRLAPGRAGDRLAREDHLYDFIVEIDHNSEPRIAGRGSAVFLHLARTNFSPTAGMRFDDEIRHAAAVAANGSADENHDRLMGNQTCSTRTR